MGWGWFRLGFLGCRFLFVVLITSGVKSHGEKKAIASSAARRLAFHFR